MASRGTSTRTAARTANTVAPWLVIRRQRLTPCDIAGDMELGTHPRSSVGDAPNQQPGQRIYNKSHKKQRQTNLDQRAEIQVTRGLGKLVGDHAGHGVA